MPLLLKSTRGLGTRWAASAKWGEAPALDSERDMPLALSLSERRRRHPLPQSLNGTNGAALEKSLSADNKVSS
jgi:hypothetical protein